ncbi:MAG: hypothetical protein KDK44_03355 [Chlamydiia bacterium]|nr:hypothetical protein [Chlamydiia bacterium]
MTVPPLQRSKSLCGSAHSQDKLTLLANLLKAAPHIDVISTEIQAIKHLLRSPNVPFYSEVTSLIENCKQPWELFCHHAPPLRNTDLTDKCAYQYHKINRLIKQIKRFSEDNNQASSINASLEKIAAVYSKFRLDCMQAKDRSTLLEGRVQIQGSGLGWRYMHQDAKPHLFQNEKRNAYGSHHVPNYQNIHWKKLPLAPGIEGAVVSLNKIISGQGSPPTQLVKISFQNVQFPFLASKTVEGVNLATLLMPLDEVPENERHLREAFDADDWLSKINPTNFSVMVASGILVDPIDGKPDNYIVQKIGSEYFIIGIDNDMAFSNVIVKSREKHQIDVKYILYLFKKQMDSPVDAAFRSHFLSLVPETVIFEWLQSLVENNQEYSKLYKLGILSVDDFDSIKLPIGLIPERAREKGLIKTLYRKLQNMHAALSNNPHLTHRALFYAAHPLLAQYYEKFEQEHYQTATKEEQTPYGAIRVLYQRDNAAKAIEDMLSMKQPMCSHLTLCAYLENKTAEMGDEELWRTQLPEEALEQFTDQIRWQTQSEESQHTSLLVLLRARFMRRFTINGCRVLTDNHLEQIGHDFKHLEALTLIGCPNVTIAGLSALLSARPNLKLKVGQNSRITASNYHFLRERNQNVTIQFSTYEEVVLGREKDGHLLQAIHDCDVPFFFYLLSLNFNPNTTDEKGLSALHLAVMSAKVNLEAAKSFITGLVLYGANQCMQQNGETPLQKAQRYAEHLESYREVIALFNDLNQSSKSDAIIENFAGNLVQSTYINLARMPNLSPEDAEKIIRRLSVAKVGVNQKTFEHLSQIKIDRIETALKCLQKGSTFNDKILILHELHLNDCPMNVEDIRSLGNALTHIKHLSLRKDSIGQREMTMLADSLKCIPVESLDLTGNVLGEGGASVIACNLRHIHHLGLGANLIRCQGAKALAQHLARSAVSHLDLSLNQIANAGVTMLSKALRHITHLNLRQNHIGIDGVMDLASNLPETLVTHLDVSYNFIGDNGALVFAAFIRKTRVVYLNLDSNSIGIKGAIALAKAVIENRILDIYFNNNHLCNDEIKQLKALLCENPNVRFHLNNVIIGHHPATPLESALH